ncbi:SMP-30/gluconolactonase/LRE family protein [Phytohabitans rumicis]|nr:superoxide dismutase [Phytohabitans rumicis]
MKVAPKPRTAIIWTAMGAALAAALALATGLATAGDEPALVDEIALPNGFQPEGVAIGAEPVAFFGSLADGAIFRADLTTGQGAVIGAAPGTPSVGLKLDDRGRLFVSGGRAGDARVVDSRTGDVLASYRLAAEGFVNDVVLTPAGAFFTDSTNPVLYHLPIGADGALPPPDGVVRIPLVGEIEYGEGINANGIALAPDGQTLLIVQTNTGLLFTVDPATGQTARTGVVDLAGDGLLPNGDGLLVLGQTLVVVQNRANTLAVLQINRTGSQADLIDRLTDERFDVPTTVAAFDDLLYLPNARFGTEATPDTEYNAVAIARP